MSSTDASFTEFVTRRGQELAKFAHLLCHDWHEAEDLVQDTLAAAYASWRRIERLAAPEAYVRRIMVNRHISLWRRRRNRPTLARDRHDDVVADISETSALSGVVAEVIRRLPARQRAAVVLRYYADYTDADIAQILGCSPSTVRSQIARATAALRADADITNLRHAGRKMS